MSAVTFACPWCRTRLEPEPFRAHLATCGPMPEPLAEAIEALPVARAPNTYVCSRCGKYFTAAQHSKHVATCGDAEEVPNYFDEHDEARVRRTGTYEDRKAKENFRRFGDPTGPKGGK